MQNNYTAEKYLHLCKMRPVIVYFISGDFNGEHIIIMEETLKSMFPNRKTDIMHVETNEERSMLLERYNLEELDPDLAKILWNAIENID